MKNFKGKNVFVTGGAGFVGSNLVEALMGIGANVTVYDNLSGGKMDFINRFKGRKNFTAIKADIMDIGKLKESLKDGTDVVVHLAANPNVALGARQTDLDLRLGTLATYNVLEAARLRNVKDVLFSSSSVVYGIADIRPTPEDYGPLRPISLYGASKLAGEGMVTAFSSIFGMDYYIFRFANVIGKNLTHGVVLDFMKKLRQDPTCLEILGDGKQRKSYIDVVDCVNAMITIYEKSPSRENIYNLATDDQCSPDEIAELVINKVAKGAKIRHTGGTQGWPGDVPNAWLSNKKMLSMGVKLRFRESRDALSNFIDGVE